MKICSLLGLLACLYRATAEGNGTSNFTLPETTPRRLSADQPVLRPVVPPALGQSRLESLQLQSFGQLFFSSEEASDTVAPGTAARLSMNYRFPSLILDHALETYDEVSCADGRSMSLVFRSREYYEFVQSEWTQHREMVVITSDSSCASYAEGGHHIHFKATNLEFEDPILGLNFTGNHIRFEEMIHDAHLEFGEVAHQQPEEPDMRFRAVRRRAEPMQKARSKPQPKAMLKVPSPAGATSSTSTVRVGTTLSSSRLSSITAASISVSASASTSAPASIPCGNLPSSVISGLPAASCGPGFDQVLDNALGFYDFSNDSDFLDIWTAIAPGTTVDSFFDDPADLSTPPGRRDIEKRFKITVHFTLPAAVKAIAQTVVAKASAAVQTVQKVVAALPNAIVSVAKAAVSLVKAIIDGNPSVSLTLPLRYFLGGFDSSPWGPAKLLHLWKKTAATPPSKSDDEVRKEMIKHGPELLPDNLDDISHIGIYCVRCGFNGTFKATGAIGFSITGIHNATLDMIGDLDLSMNLGIDALAIKKVELAKKRLFNTGVPGFSIPNILALGPVLYVEAGVDFEFKAIGQMLAGTTIAFRNAHSHLDFLHPSNGYSRNWKPTFTDSIKLHGELSAGLVFELPIGVMFGLDVLGGKFKESIGSLVDTSSLEITAKLELDYAASISGNTLSGTGTTSSDPSLNKGSCHGVAWDVSLHNRLDFDVLKSSNFKIFEVELPIANGCIGEEPVTAKATPSASPKASLPSVPGCPTGSLSDNQLQNGDFSDGQLGAWFIFGPGTSSQDTYDISQGYFSATQNSDPSYSNPYSSVTLRQNIVLCPGTQYTFSFDYQYDSQQYDVYTYATVFKPDGTGQNVFAVRTYSDSAAIGQWQHYSTTFTAQSSTGIFEILTLACNYESTVSLYDNFVIRATSNTKRTLDARQDPGSNDDDDANDIQLDQTADGSNEDTDDVADFDTLDPFNQDGSLATPPDDSDLDTYVDDSASDLADSLDNDQDFASLAGSNDTATSTTPPTGSNDTALTPPLPDANGISFLTLPSLDRTAQLSAGSDGNVYLEAVDGASPSGLFVSSGGVFAADFQSRILHMYADEMQTLNVSRLRLSDAGGDAGPGFPRSARVVGLVGVSVNSGTGTGTGASTSLMVASDTAGGIYFLAACNLQGQSTKVFLVRDVVGGLQTLRTALASWTVTGGVATSCFALGIAAPQVVASV